MTNASESTSKNSNNDQSQSGSAPPSSSSYIFNIIWAVCCVIVAIGINRIDKFYFLTKQTESHKSITETTESTFPDEALTPPYQADFTTTTPTLEFEKEGSFRSQVFRPPEEHPNSHLRDVKGDWADYPPGHMGLGVEIVRMDKKTKMRREEMYNTHAFEEFVSELIPLERELPDWRDQWCLDKYDGGIESLSQTSIIICFHNEAWSTLLRSIHSVVNRSPKSLIKEIILVDDHSHLKHLGAPLEEYIKNNFPPNLVKIIRLESRHGLMKSRMEGIKASTAPILTFLDSHIEASKGWLEPLLHRIKENPKTIPSPVIDAINDTTLYYTFIKKDLFGLMNWKMEFEWQEVKAEESALKPNKWAPHNNPVMAGGLFSISKKWFEELGYYDEGMNVWGGENFELSFKAWMCGGQIEILPCSRVGHIYRSWSPYKVSGVDIKRNNIRVAKVWMDKFQYLYFDRFGNYDKKGDARLDNDYGDISSRVQLRKSLQCKDFEWYLKNIAFGLPYHDLTGAGFIRNVESRLCLDKNDKTEFMDHPVDLNGCHYNGGNQYWWINKNRYILRDYMCIGVMDDGLTVVVTHCGKASSWEYLDQNKQFIYGRTGTCLTSFLEKGTNKYILTMQKCRENDPSQQWEITIRNPSGLRYEELFYH